MGKFKQMSAEEFDSQVPRLAEDFTSKTIKLARLVLVDGLNQKQAAEQVGMSRQNVAKTIERVLARFNQYPANWVLLKPTWMPPELAVEVRARIDEALIEHQNKREA